MMRARYFLLALWGVALAQSDVWESTTAAAAYQAYEAGRYSEAEKLFLTTSNRGIPVERPAAGDEPEQSRRTL
jgi:hypothetical protein